MTEFKKHIIIVGSARSGTSWLAETIAKQHRYRLLFEPDHEFQTKKGVLLCDKWIESRTDAPQAFDYLDKVFANRVDNDWIAQSSNRKWKRHLWPGIPVKFVIKFVRTNLMASAMNKEFGIPVLHIIRNPYDTIASQQRVKFPWLYDLSHFQNQPKLVAMVKDKYNIDLGKIDLFSDIEKLALRWCMENVIPIEILKVESESYKVVRHQDLRADVNLFLNLCREFGLEPISNIKEKYTTPSSKTHPKSNILGKKDTLPKFTDLELAKVNAIFTIFQMNLYPKKMPH